MIQANELRIGNLLNYQTAEGDVVTLTTDFGAIKWATEDPKGFNLVHTPIPLTEEWLAKLGFEEVHLKNRHYSIIDKNGFKDSHKISILPTINEQWYIAFSDTLFGYKDYIPTTKIKFVHELQNLYFALTGEELTIK